MTEQNFIALADRIRNWQAWAKVEPYHFVELYQNHIEMLADFCQDQNPGFDRQRWLDYVAGTHGPNGGKR